MKNVALKSFFALFLLSCMLFQFSCSKKDGASSESKRVPLSKDASDYISRLSESAKSIKAQRPMQYDTLSAQIKDHLAGKGVLGKGDWTLALSYVLEGDYEKGIEEYDKALRRPSTSPEFQASAHSGLGNVYYDLAILDMTDRGLYSQNKMGFIAFNPDSRTRIVLEAAKNEFDAAATISGVAESERSRMRQLNIYLSGGSSDVVLTIDQASAMMWLMGISEQKPKPELMEVVKKNLDAFRWVRFLGNEPMIAEPLLSEARKRRFKEIDSMGLDFGFQLKGIYNMACLTAVWVPSWSSYKVMAEKGRRANEYDGMLRYIGGSILECSDLLGLADLLGLELSQGTKDGLNLKTMKQENGFGILLYAEPQLKERYSKECSMLFALIHTENMIVTYSRNLETFGLLVPAIPRFVQNLRKISEEAEAGQDIQSEFYALSQMPCSNASFPVGVVSATDKLFSKILADIKAKGVK